MAVDAALVRNKYVQGLQAAATLALQFNTKLDELALMYSGNGLSGTFVDAELLADVNMKHLAAADIGTYTSNLDTLNTAMTSGILQNMAKAIGKPIGT